MNVVFPFANVELTFPIVATNKAIATANVITPTFIGGN